MKMSTTDRPARRQPRTPTKTSRCLGERPGTPRAPSGLLGSGVRTDMRCLSIRTACQRCSRAAGVSVAGGPENRPAYQTSHDPRRRTVQIDDVRGIPALGKPPAHASRADLLQSRPQNCSAFLLHGLPERRESAARKAQDPVPRRRRQPFDRRQARMQLTPMKTRRELQKQPAVRAQDAKKLFEIAPRFSRVLDDVSREDEVERCGLERQSLAVVQQGEQTLQPVEPPATEIHVYRIDLDTVN